MKFSMRRRLLKVGAVVAMVIAALSCIAVWKWFPNTASVFIRADSDVPLNISHTIGSALSIWTSSNFGSDNARTYPMLVPYVLLWYVLHHCFSDSIIQRSWWMGLILAGILGIRFLLGSIGLGIRSSWLATATAIVLYSFTAYSSLSFAIGHDILYLAYVASPWILGFGIRSMRYGRFWDILAGVLISSLIAGAYSNPPIIITAVLLPVLIFALSLFVARQVRPHAVLTYVWQSAALFALINAWWMLPFLRLTLVGVSDQTIIPADQHFNWPNFTNPIESHLTLFQLGYWGLFTGFAGQPYFPTASKLWNPLALLGYALAICLLVVAALMANRRKLAIAAPALLLFILGLIGAKANNEPLGGLSMWIFQHIPGFWIFRSAYEKFTAASLLGLAIGAAFGVRLVQRKLSSSATMGHIFTLISILGLAGISWPFLVGGLVKTDNIALGYQAFSSIPPEYEQLYRITERLSGGRILVIPGIEYARYVWGAASGDLLRHYIGHPYVEDAPGFVGSNDARSLIRELSAVDSDFQYLGSQAGIQYVLIRSDIDGGNFGYHYDGAAQIPRLRPLIRREVMHNRYFRLLELRARPNPPAFVAEGYVTLANSRDARWYISDPSIVTLKSDLGIPEASGAVGATLWSLDGQCDSEDAARSPVYCDSPLGPDGMRVGPDTSQFKGHPVSLHMSAPIIRYHTAWPPGMLEAEYRNGRHVFSGEGSAGFAAPPILVPAGRAIHLILRTDLTGSFIGDIAIESTSVPSGKPMRHEYIALRSGLRTYSLYLEPRSDSRSVRLTIDLDVHNSVVRLTGLNASAELSTGRAVERVVNVRRSGYDLSGFDKYAGMVPEYAVTSHDKVLNTWSDYAKVSRNAQRISLSNIGQVPVLYRFGAFRTSGGSPSSIPNVSGSPFTWRTRQWTYAVAYPGDELALSPQRDHYTGLIYQRVDGPIPFKQFSPTKASSPAYTIALRSTWYGYQAVLPDIATPMALVLGCSFDNGWTLWGARKAHLVAQGFANGWVLAPHSRYVRIVYWGKALQLIGTVVTIASILGVVLFAVKSLALRD